MLSSCCAAAMLSHLGETAMLSRSGKAAMPDLSRAVYLVYYTKKGESQGHYNFVSAYSKEEALQRVWEIAYSKTGKREDYYHAVRRIMEISEE